MCVRSIVRFINIYIYILNIEKDHRRGGCDFGVLLYLFTQLLYVFLQDVFTMLSGKPMIYQYISYGQLTFSGVNR